MSGDESAESRQNNELEALKAIYGDDLKDLRGKAAWNKWTPLKLTISLIPQQGSSGLQESYAKVDLSITCSETYPNSAPDIFVYNNKGLSLNDVEQLVLDLRQRADELKGEEMIFQLCQYVQEFLHLHNKPTSKSFYDEMLQRQLEQEQEDLQARQLEENIQREYLREEVQKRQEILKSETRLRREKRYNSENSENDGDIRRQSISNTFLENSDECVCDHNETSVIQFNNRNIQRGQCLKHCSFNHVVFIGMDLKSGEIVLLSEWTIEIKSMTELNHVLKQLSSIEQELNYLTKLKHQNLVRYLNFKYDQVSDEKINVFILKEFIDGPNCSFFMSENFISNIQFIKYISKGVLTALDYLHRNNVVHKDIRETSVYIDDKGIVALSNYSLHRRLTDLFTQSNGYANYSRKTDIFKFGVFILSLIQGSTLTSDDDVAIPTTIPADLYDFLAKCLNKHEKERLTASQLLSHTFFEQQVVNLSPNHKPDKKNVVRNESPDINHHELLSQSSGQSRVKNEFEFLQHLGKGAFGDVIKVRNILDGGYYAIKRIQLNPKNKQLNRKIVREVKLLSRLNHENVVRYYNSWIETTVIKNEESSDFSRNNSSRLHEKVPRIVRHNEFTMNDNIEELAPPLKNVEVSITYDSKSQAAFNASSDEDMSSDDEENWGAYNGESDSDGIEFANDTTADTISEQSAQSAKSADTADTSCNKSQIEFMYIQMEFCDKSTLRTAIDNNIYLDEGRVWRLFREIVEGLAHIHQQGMIHRDLKPVNIFLDIDDHVKIGDFGLATTSIKSKLNEYSFKRGTVDVKEDALEDESKTGLIGTALYVAPELSVASKAIYNQKVDIYSLGIIFFEMCYKSLSTNMERITILTGLRKAEIVLPKEFVQKRNSKQIVLIKWLLTHDVAKRPTSQELLESDHVPPPVVEERELRELVRHTLNNPQLKGYKYLIASCFNQTLTPAQDITYDKDPSAPNVAKPLQLYDFVRSAIIKIFKQHGGQNLPTPLLMPKSQYYDGVESCVKLMTHFGGIVTIAHDLRVPFARYVAWNGITLLRRFAIERVYREKKVFGFLPRELFECAFDIVTPTAGNLASDAEILYMVYEIINELPGIKNKHFIIRLNHTSLLRAILLHFGIKGNHQEVFQMIADVKDGKVTKTQLQTYLINFGLSDNSISTITNIFNSEFEVSKAANQLQAITKKKSGEASHLARQALQDLKTISHNAEAFGVTFEMVIAPGVVYNAQQYSGMICQFVCELKKKHKHGNMEVLAAGGRYDSMITCYRKIMENANMLSRDINQSAVGISLSLDKLVQALQREQHKDLPKIEYLDAVVCSVGTKPLMKEKTKILRTLWSAGIRCSLLETTNNEEIQEQCAELKVPHVVMLKDSEQGTVRVLSWERDRFQEKTFKINELAENMQKIIRNWKEGSQEYLPAANAIPKSEIKSSYGEKNEHCHEADVSVVFETAEKLSSNARKRYEVQIRSHLDNLFKRLTGHVIVIGLSFDSNVIRTLASYLEFESEQQFHKSVENVIEKHPRHKKYLNDVCDEIYEQKAKRTNPIIILFSLSDSFHKILF